MIPKIISIARKLISDRHFSEILTGSAWALSARITATAMGLVSSIIIARVYGAEMMGIVAIVQSFLIIATMLTVMGTNTSLLRLIPEHLLKYSPTSAYLVYRKVLSMVIIVSLVTSMFFFANAHSIAKLVFSKPHLSFYFSVGSIFIVFKSLAILNTQAIRGIRRIKVFALMLVFPQTTNLLILICIGSVFPNHDLPVYALLSGITLTGIAGLGIMFFSFKSKIGRYDTIGSVTYSKLLSVSLPMLMTSGMTFLIGQTGVIILGIFRSELEVGYYAVAVKLATLTTFILSAVNSMAGPKFSELFHSNKMEELFSVAQRSTKLIFWSTTPILIGFIFIGNKVLDFFFGAEFSVAYPALVLLAIGQFIHSISGATGLFMNMTGNEKRFRNIVSTAAVANIIINLLLIPKYGLYGAATAAMLCLTGWNIATLIFMKIKYGKTTCYFPLVVHSY